MTNEAKMTLEERIVQSLKNDSLMKLVADEDAVTELVKRAIQEALYQPRRVEQSYGRFEQKDSIVVAAARDMAEKAVRAHIDTMMATLMADKNFRKTVEDQMLRAIPGVMMRKFTEHIEFTATDMAVRTLNSGR